MSQANELVENHVADGVDESISAPAVQADQAVALPQNSVELVTELVTSGKYTLDQVTTIMDIVDRQDAKTAKQAFDDAMSKFRRLMPVLEKDKRVYFAGKGGKPDTDYMHTSLGHTMEIANPILGECGLNVRWDVDQESNPAR